MSLPGAPHLSYHHHELQLDGISLADLARTYGTPLYVYSQAAMQSAASAYQQALQEQPHLLCYAMKANSSLAILQTFAQMGLGFDIVSAGELQRVLAAGGDPNKVVFSGVGKTRAEMAFALKNRVRCFNVESAAELETLSDVASQLGLTAPVSLRVNPNVDAQTHPYISTGLKGNKFGISHEQALAVYRCAAQLPGIEIKGIDCHIGSQITECAPYLDALDRVLDLVEKVEADGIDITHIDLGGGLGITYTDETPPSAHDLVSAMLKKLKQRQHGHREIFLEPGRSLVGNAGVLLTQALYLKPATDDEIHQGGRHFCIVDAAMNDLMRPAMYEAWMAIEPCQLKTTTPSRSWDIVGPVCESGDWLGKDRHLAIDQGDYLAVLSAGAYGMSMSSNYNTRPRAAEVLICDGNPQLIRERESLESLLATERLVT